MSKCAVNSIALFGLQAKVIIPLEGIVDLDEEVKRIQKLVEKLQKDITDFVTSQQYHKASRAKDQLMEIENTIREKRGPLGTRPGAAFRGWGSR